MRADNISQLIGNTDLLKLESLSKLTGSDIYIKCEYQNPGGSIKDRAAIQMVLDAIKKGELKPGMTIVEGTAGNTGIGLALVAKALGYGIKVVMPKGQTIEKERMIGLHGGDLHLVPPCPFKDPNHFYHTARRMAEENEQFWWANQFENLSNYRAHYLKTGPEIWQQTEQGIDVLVSVCSFKIRGSKGCRRPKIKNHKGIHTLIVTTEVLSYIAQYRARICWRVNFRIVL